MGAQFDTEHIKMKEGQNLMERLREALKEKGQADRMSSDYGLFFLTEVTVKTINRDEVLLEVGYEYGG